MRGEQYLTSEKPIITASIGVSGMLKKLSLAGLACVLFSGVALAERWVPLKVSMTAEVLDDGATMMKVTMPEKEYLGFGRDMRSPSAVCRVQNVAQGPSTVITYLCTAE